MKTKTKWNNIWIILALNIDLVAIQRRNQTVIWEGICACIDFGMRSFLLLTNILLLLLLRLFYYYCHRNQYFQFYSLFFYCCFACSVPLTRRLLGNDSQRLWESKKGVSIDVWWLWLCKILFKIWALYIYRTWQEWIQAKSNRSIAILWERLYIRWWRKLFKCRLIARITENEWSS